MKPKTIALASLLVLGLAGLAVPLWTAGNDAGPSAPPTDPGGVSDVLLARPFRLEVGYAHSFRAERPLVTAGWLVVLDVEPDRIQPRQTLEPVLYVGQDTAERFNAGWPSGRVIAIVPASEDADGRPAGPPTRAWFGPPELPERIDAAALAVELGRASEAGVGVLVPERLDAALELGGELLALSDRGELDSVAAQLVLEYAPGEEEFARSRLVPRAR